MFSLFGILYQEKSGNPVVLFVLFFFFGIRPPQSYTKNETGLKDFPMGPGGMVGTVNKNYKKDTFLSSTATK
jgi:hypothetical protein